MDHELRRRATGPSGCSDKTTQGAAPTELRKPFGVTVFYKYSVPTGLVFECGSIEFYSFSNAIRSGGKATVHESPAAKSPGSSTNASSGNPFASSFTVDVAPAN